MMITFLKRIFRVAILSIVTVNLADCATATRGSTTLFIVETAPLGSKATTTVPTKEFGKMTRVKLDRIKSGKLEEPNFKYRFCEPTPCGIEMPRKRNFHVLVAKDGYTPQVHEIGYMHRKQIKKETMRNTALAAGAVGIGTGVAISASAGSSILFGSSAAVGTAAGIVVATPSVLVGGVSLGVDAATGANYDVWPNPLPLTLQTVDNADPEWADVEAVKVDFGKMQNRNAMKSPSTKREERIERKRLLADKRREARRQKTLAKDKQKKPETTS